LLGVGGGEPTPFQYSHAPQNAPVNHRGTQYFCCMHVRSADCAVQLKYLSASTANQHLIPSGQAPLRQLISEACNAPSLQTLYACNITTLPRVDVQANTHRHKYAHVHSCIHVVLFLRTTVLFFLLLFAIPPTTRNAPTKLCSGVQIGKAMHALHMLPIP
jgi:hypothetical protein